MDTPKKPDPALVAAFITKWHEHTDTHGDGATAWYLARRDFGLTDPEALRLLEAYVRQQKGPLN